MGGLPETSSTENDAAKATRSASTWAAFRRSAYPLALARAAELRAAEEDEDAPYASKYAAADLLLQLQQEAETHVGSDQHGPEAAACLARLQLERGLALIETDLLSEGEASLKIALDYAWPSEPECLALQQQAQNALAALWDGRSDFKRALEHLQRALALYEQGKQQQKPKQQQQGQQEGEEQPGAGSRADAADTLPAASSEATAGPCCTSEPPDSQPAVANTGAECTPATTTAATAAGMAAAAGAAGAAGISTPDQLAERCYTTTLFYLAQVHGHAGDKDKSALFCAATLNRQLRDAGPDLPLSDWVQNCLQLSGFFVDANAFAVSEYFLTAANLVVQQHGQQPQRQGQQGQQRQDEKKQGHQAGQQAVEKGQPQQQHRQNQDQRPEPDQQKQEEDHHQHQQQQEQQQLQVLDDDVRANLWLAWAKLYLYRLVASHKVHVEGGSIKAPYASPSALPELFRFDAIPGLPDLTTLPWGEAALAQSFEAARDLFNAAMPRFNKALEHYQLDGWVTEHVNIQFEVSNLYRCLAGFENDPHRACVMHKRRTRGLLPLEGALNMDHFPGLARSVSLELGNVYREIQEIKEDAGWDASKVAAAALDAAKHYQAFLDSFAKDGKAPGKVDPDNEGHYLGACFSLGRVLHKAGGSSRDLQTLEASQKYLRSVADYVKRNNVASHTQEAALADELAGLVGQKLLLLQQLHAQLRQ